MSKAKVVSVRGKGPTLRWDQVCERKTNESEPLIRHRKAFDVGKTMELRFPWDKSGSKLCSAQMPAGVEAA